ncbi:MAG TPA: NaeI family type II restriction endonuclease [Acidimicrobiales bacterium]|nr:NaeI family type II restriction endonuclease [Acidimicrobiales bacterium]
MFDRSIGGGPPARGEDVELDLVTDWFSNSFADMPGRFGAAIRKALDELIDTPRTGRWSIEQCNKQEKAYVGVKVEHVIREQFGLPHGVRADFAVAGVDVDCKWSNEVGCWQIPIEAVGNLCLLVWANDHTSEMAVGVLRTVEELLVGGNRDRKRTIQRPAGVRRIRWLVPRGPGLPENFLLHLDPDYRAAILAHRGGDARARELFIRCEGVVIRRHTIESVGRQVDEGRRFRGETRAALLADGFEVLNGHWRAQQQRAKELGGPVPRDSTEWVCLRSDGSTPARLAARRRGRDRLF